MTSCSWPTTPPSWSPNNNPADVAALLALPLDGKTLDEVRAALIGKIGENMSIRRFQRFETHGKLASYISRHRASA